MMRHLELSCYSPMSKHKTHSPHVHHVKTVVHEHKPTAQSAQYMTRNITLTCAASSVLPSSISERSIVGEGEATEVADGEPSLIPLRELRFGGVIRDAIASSKQCFYVSYIHIQRIAVNTCDGNTAPSTFTNEFFSLLSPSEGP